MLLKDNDQCSFINTLNLKKDYSWKTKLVPVKGKVNNSEKYGFFNNKPLKCQEYL